VYVQAWQKKRKQDLKVCLSELQSIIDVKAAERVDRERAAMDRMMTSAMTPTFTQRPLHPDHYDGDDEKGDGEDGRRGEVGLAQDLEDRMQFWKQFDLAQRATAAAAANARIMEATTTTTTTDDAGVAATSSSSLSATWQVEGSGFLVVGSDRSKDSPDSDFSVIPESISNSASHESDFSIIPESVSNSTSAESGFVVIAEKEGALAVKSLATSDLLGHDISKEMGQDDDDDVIYEGGGGDGGGKVLGAAVSSSWYQVPPERSRSELDQSEESGEEVSSSPDLISLSPADHGSASPTQSRSRSPARSRSGPEGTEEHLSLPGGPSPFAFSVAAMVANRAKHLGQVEDTFGDSESEGEEVGEEEEG
jgi:hypothetical protein